MTKESFNTNNKVLVAIDIAKTCNDVLVELPNGARKRLKVANMIKDYKEFLNYLKSLGLPCEIGLEATANYHRNIAYHLQMADFKIHLISEKGVNPKSSKISTSTLDSASILFL